VRQSLRCNSERSFWGLRSENVASTPGTRWQIGKLSSRHQSHFNDAGTIHVVYHLRSRAKSDTVPPGTEKDIKLQKLQPPNVDVPVSAIDTEADFPRRPSQHFRHRRNPNASHNHIGQFSPQRINDAFTTQNYDTQSSRNRGVLVNTRGQRRDIGRRS
jgi:hypothetical protein